MLLIQRIFFIGSKIFVKLDMRIRILRLNLNSGHRDSAADPIYILDSDPDLNFHFDSKLDPDSDYNNFNSK